jgi:Cu(I)/Ag(I) efflux system membrane protein CusA/SilA
LPLQGSRPGAVLLAADHHRLLPAGVHAGGQEGRLFSPLAYTKTFSMAGAALLSVTLVPVLMLLFIRGKIMPEAKNPVNRFLIWATGRSSPGDALEEATIVAALIAWWYPSIPPPAGLRVHADPQRRHLLYMPASLPGMSITKAAELMQTQDKIIKSFPEVESVFGKAGRANTATDPAPTEMFETVINLKPEPNGGRDDHRQADRRDGQGAAVPGVSNAWTMPIKARTDMLSTGIRTPIGIKVFGKDLDEMESWPRKSRRWSGCRAPPVPLPSASPAASTSTSNRTGSSWPATAWPSATCRM